MNMHHKLRYMLGVGKNLFCLFCNVCPSPSSSGHWVSPPHHPAVTLPNQPQGSCSASFPALRRPLSRDSSPGQCSSEPPWSVCSGSHRAPVTTKTLDSFLIACHIFRFNCNYMCCTKLSCSHHSIEKDWCIHDPSTVQCVENLSSSQYERAQHTYHRELLEP